MQPLVTIAIPTYQRLNYLKEAVSSALNQTYGNIEVVISQDCTPKGVDPEIRKWAQSVQQENPKVKYYFSTENLGLAGNWNQLVEKASGDYMIIIGDDDRLLPDAIERLVTSIHPEHNVAFSNHYLINENGERLEEESWLHTERFNRGGLKAGAIANPAKVIWQNAVPMSAALIRRQDLRRLTFKEDLNTPEIEFFLRLANEDGKFTFIADYLTEYRVHSGSATNKGLKVHRLLNYLLSIPVSKDNETHKREFIKGLISPAVSLLIAEGNIQAARDYYNSNYYSLMMKLHAKGLLHLLALYLPFGLGLDLFNFINHFRKSK